MALSDPTKDLGDYMVKRGCFGMVRWQAARRKAPLTAPCTQPLLSLTEPLQLYVHRTSPTIANRADERMAGLRKL